jgi:prevent-host-death family protein
MAKWQVQEAKARFSDLVKSAIAEGPQEITVHGTPAAVVLSAEEYKRLSLRQLSFVEFIRQSPLVGLELDLTRDQTPTRRTVRF